MNTVGKQEFDSLDSYGWKTFLEPDALVEAWSPPKGSPFGSFRKNELLRKINEVASGIKPRYSLGEARSEFGIQNLLDVPKIFLIF